MNIFVYGTLKKNFPNHKCIELSNGKYLGKTFLRGYKMYSLGAFPVIVPYDNILETVQGEVYTVDNLTILDRLEGYPHFYNRKIVYTIFGETWVYFQQTVPYDNVGLIDIGVWNKRV